MIHSIALYYLLQLFMRFDAFGVNFGEDSRYYVEMTAVNFIASWTLPALSILSAIRIRCRKPKSEEMRTVSFVFRCAIFSLHLHGIAQVAMFTVDYKEYSPYVSMKSDVYLCGFATMVSGVANRVTVAGGAASGLRTRNSSGHRT